MLFRSSDEAFAAVEQIGLLYNPDDVVLVHGVDLGMFQSPIVAGAVNLQGYEEFRQALIGDWNMPRSTPCTSTTSSGL